MYGSTVNGLLAMGKEPSDLDLTLINDNFTETKDTNHLQRVKKTILRRAKEYPAWQFP